VAGPPLVALALLAVPASVGIPRLPNAPETTAPQAQAALLRAPLAFEPSAGRFTHGVRFVARGQGYALSLTRDEAVASVGSARVHSRLVGGSATPRGERRLRGVVNWLAGPDRADWKTGIPTFGAVRYPRVYPGTDLIYHGRGGALEYDFRLAPGADPRRIALDFDPAPRLTSSGNLEVPAGDGHVRQLRPVAFQTVAGRRVPVDAAFDVSGARVRFRVGGYDRSRPLVIDPEFAFRTYAGGSFDDKITAVAVKGSELYAGGDTFSSDFYGAPHDVGGLTAFIMGGAADGTTRDWVTYMSNARRVGGLAVDSNGAVFGVGDATAGFATTAGAFQASVANNTTDGYVIKLDGANGSVLAATYLGGTGEDHNNAVAVDSSGNVYVAGDTFSTGMATAGTVKTTRDFQDGFLARLNGSLHTRDWYTYMGTTTGNDSASGVVVDSSGFSYVTGSAQGDAFTGAGNTLGQDAFLIKLTSAGAASVDTWSKLLGGSQQEFGNAIAIDSSGRVAIAGSTTSTHGATVSDPPPFGETPNNQDAFVYEVNSDGSVYHKDVIGGGGTDSGDAVAFDDLNNLYLMANSSSNDFETKNAITVGGNPVSTQGVMAVKYKPSDGTIVYSTPIAGGGGQDGHGAAADSTGVYIGGLTNTPLDFTTPPASVAPYQASSSGTPDGFLVKIKPSAPKIVDGPPEGSVVASGTAREWLSTSKTV
jgi:hypothetical protein